MCFIGRCVIIGLGISRHNVETTTEKLGRANGEQIKLDGIIFMNLTVGVSRCSQLVYVTPKVTSLFISPKACKELSAMQQNFTELP